MKKLLPKNFFRVLGFAALALARPALVSAAGDPMSLSVLQAGVGLSFLSLAATSGELASLPCMTEEAKGNLENFQANSTRALMAFNQSYKDYVATVTKPMAGNGKCAGGFQAVAVESEARRELTAQLEARMLALQTAYAMGMNMHFVDAMIDSHDESAGQQCSNKSSELYDAVEAAGLAANNSFSKFRVGVAVTGMRFASYASKNTGLSDDCGSLAADMGSMLSGISVADTPVPSGKSVNPESTITGRIGNENLESLSGSTSQGSQSGATGAGEQAGAGEITGADAKKNAESVSLRGFGSNFTGVAGKTDFKNQEEMLVQTIMKGGAGAQAELANGEGHVTAPSLEVLMAAHNEAELAQGKINAKVDGGAEGRSPANDAKAGAASLAHPDRSLFDRVRRVLRSGTIR